MSLFYPKMKGVSTGKGREKRLVEGVRLVVRAIAIYVGSLVPDQPGYASIPCGRRCGDWKRWSNSARKAGRNPGLLLTWKQGMGHQLHHKNGPQILRIKTGINSKPHPEKPEKGETGCVLFDTHVGEHTRKQGKSVCGYSRNTYRGRCWFGAMEIFRGPKRAAPPGKPQQ